MNRVEINCLHIVDIICDYIPIVSTITNLVELFFKCFILPYFSPEDIQNSHFYTHLQEKSFGRCVLLLVPILGNIIIGILDCQKGCESSEGELLQFTSSDGDDESLEDAENFLIEEVRERGVVDLIMTYAGHRMSEEEKAWLARVRVNGLVLRDASAEIRGNFEIVKAAVQNEAMALEFADDALKDDEEIVLAAVRSDSYLLRKDSCAFQFASDRLKNTARIVRLAMPRNLMGTLQYASEEMRGNFEIIKEAVWYDSSALVWASKALRDNEEIIREAMSPHRPYALFHASDRLRGDAEFVKEAIQRYGQSLWCASKALRDNEDIVRLAIDNDPENILHASPRLQQLLLVHSEALRDHVEAAIRNDPDDLRYVGLQQLLRR